MKFRSATQADTAQICALERLPEFRTMVGSWAEAEHMRMLADPDALYIVAEDPSGRIAAFAILRGLLSEHKQVELKRVVVRTPNQGVGRELLTEVARPGIRRILCAPSVSGRVRDQRPRPPRL
jgi:hypothetical protein